MATGGEKISEWDKNPRMPVPPPPAGSCDCQFHIYGDPAKFPPRANPPYPPIESATFREAQRMHKAIGFDRGVIVHSAIYGSDHRLLLHALEGLNDRDRYRGIGIVDDRVSDKELERMHATESLRHSEERLANILASATDAIVAIEESHSRPPRLVARVGDESVSLFDGAPAAVTSAPHAGLRRVTFESGDGMEIEGFLFTPRVTDPPVAAVVYPHGGPTSVYGDEWDGHAQYFIDKGYAWLAINFRGSTTYGLTFERANHDDWGIGDTEDCIAAGHYLAALDWVDADRIAIFGASYGSYMALAALVHRDNPFACGVAKYGDCDILTSWAQGDRPGSDDLERMMGHPTANRLAYRAGSPIHQVERLDRPIFVAHGEQDARVHVKQAEELVAELRRLDKRYEYVTYPEESHGFLRKESQLDFYRRLERFLDWHLL